MDIKNIIKRELKEDLGKGDITTAVTIPKNAKIKAVIIAKETGVLCGIDIAGLIFKTLNTRIKFSPAIKDGSQVYRGKIIARISGSAAGILSGERLALNFLGLLSGIATRTQRFVKKIGPFKTKILDTRKTIPGLRGLQKYAVRIGGGWNHRFGLDDMALIKENHIDVAGINNIREIVKKIKNKWKAEIKVEAEVRNLKEFKLALSARPDIIMLDNMSPKDIKIAVKLRDRLTHSCKPQLEASGNISIANIKKYAATGVNFISLGTLTKDIDSLDFSLEITQKL